MRPSSPELGVYSLHADLGEAQRIARASVEGGIAGTWFAETSTSALQCATAAALVAPRQRIATCVTVAFARSPMVVAHESWEIARLTGNRFVLGLGTQVRAHVERRFSAPFDHPVARLRDYVGALRAIFDAFGSGDRLTYRGEFYRFSLLPEFFRPTPDPAVRVPIFLAGVNPAMTALAAEVADGLVVHPVNSVRYLEDVVGPLVRAGPRGSEDDFELVVPAFLRFSADGSEDGADGASSDAVRSLLAFYGATPAYRRIFEHHGWGEVADGLAAALRRGDPAGGASLISEEMLDTFSVRGTWEGAAQQLRTRYGGVADWVLPYPVQGPITADDDRERWAGVARELRSSHG